MRALLILFSLMIASSFASAEQVISSRTNESFLILQGEDSLGCYPEDSNRDGIIEKTTIVFKYGWVLDGTIGFLQNHIVSNTVTGESAQTICDDINEIIESLPNSYMALHGSYSSELTLTNDKLVENIVITVKDSRRAIPQAKTVTFTATVEQAL